MKKVTSSARSRTSQPSSTRSTRSVPARGKRYPKKLKDEIIQHIGKQSVESAEKKYRISKSTLHRWIRHENKDSSVSEENTPPVVDKSRENLVLDMWHQHPGYGPSQIKNMLRRENVKISIGSVREIMLADGYVAPVKKPRQKVNRYEAGRPQELYHLDFYHFHVHKQHQRLLFIIDDFSRFIVGWKLCEQEYAEAVMITCEECIARYGKPEGMMSDRGSAFHSWKGLSRFQSMLEEYEINFYLAKEPQVNGKAEALNAAFQKECLRQIEFTDLNHAAMCIAHWVNHFNHKRVHHSLGGILVPADRFYGLSDHVMGMLEQGQTPRTHELLTPHDRVIDIVRLVSESGSPQLYIMGKKIFG